MSALHKILVVDDDPVVGTSFDRVLSRKGYQVIKALNAHEALEQLRKDEVDAVYTDIKMPGMTGLEFAEKVKARRPWTPVVIVTGYGTEADERRAMEAGVAAFLHKPLSPEMIEESANEVLHAALPPTAAAEAEAAEPAPERVGLARRLGNMALFLAAPFIGLVYAMFLPFVGMGALAWMGGKELVRRGAVAKAAKVLKFVGMAVGAPLIGLAYAVLLPFAGLAGLAWMAVKAFEITPVGRRVMPVVKFATMLVAAPFIGLAYIVALPFAGLVTLAWIGGRGWKTMRAARRT